MRKRRRDKKKKRRQKRKYAELQKSVINELKQVLKSRNSVSELKLVDKSLCDYFKTYELDASQHIKTLLICLLIKNLLSPVKSNMI